MSDPTITEIVILRVEAAGDEMKNMYKHASVQKMLSDIHKLCRGTF